MEWRQPPCQWATGCATLCRALSIYTTHLKDGLRPILYTIVSTILYIAGRRNVLALRKAASCYYLLLLRSEDTTNMAKTVFYKYINNYTLACLNLYRCWIYWCLSYRFSVSLLFYNYGLDSNATYTVRTF